MRYIFSPEGEQTVMHIELHNPLGEPLGRPFCGASLVGARTINMPLGQPKCPECFAAVRAVAFNG